MYRIDSHIYTAKLYGIYVKLTQVVGSQLQARKVHAEPSKFVQLVRVEFTNVDTAQGDEETCPPTCGKKVKVGSC